MFGELGRGTGDFLESDGVVAFTLFSSVDPVHFLLLGELGRDPGGFSDEKLFPSLVEASGKFRFRYGFVIGERFCDRL